MLSQQLDYDRGLREFLEQTAKNRMPGLVNFALHNRTVLSLVHHLRRHTTGSVKTAFIYLYGIWKYSQWLHSEPDKILFDCWGPDGDPLPKMLLKHSDLVDDFVGYLKDLDLAPGSIALYVNSVKALYRANRVSLQLPRYPRTLVHPNRAPSPRELESVLDVADIREKVIISLSALGGFRLGTLCKLVHGDIRDELERGLVPLMVTVKPGITKGHYAPYHTFLPRETIDYLKAYLVARRLGTEKVRPETLRDDSPLIRDAGSSRVRPITPDAMWRIISNLYRRAGLNKDTSQKGYKSRKRFDLRPHSLRYYFRTQLTSLGCPGEYAEFMMGHKGALYNDIRMKGPEFLREIYRRCNLSIRQKTPASRKQILIEAVRSLGFDPEKTLVKDALSEPHRAIAGHADLEERDEQALYRMLQQAIVEVVQQMNATVSPTRV